MLDHDLAGKIVTLNGYLGFKLKEMNTTVKLLVVFSLLFMNVFFGSIMFSLSILLSALILTVLIKVNIREVFVRIKFPILFGLVIFFLQVTSLRDGELLLQVLGVGIYSEGIKKGLRIFFTLIGGVWYLVLVGLTSTVDSILSAFRRIGVPKVVVDISLMMYRYSFLLYEEALRVFYAQKSRLGYVNFRNSIRSLGQLWGIVLVNSILRSVRVNEAMRSRNFSGKLFYDFRAKPSLGEVVVGVVYVLFFFCVGITLKLVLGV